MDKITWREAAKMEKDIGAYIMHIGWASPLAEKHPDCSAVVLDCDKDRNDPKAQLALVLDDPEAEQSVGSYWTRLADRGMI